MRCIALVAASGIGSRFGGDVPKQFSTHDGSTVLEICIKRAVESRAFDGFIIAVESDYLGKTHQLMRSIPDIPSHSVIIGGQVSRGETFDLLLDCARDVFSLTSNDICALVDANRPLTPPDLYRETVEAAAKTGVACPVLPLSDGLAIVEGFDDHKTIKSSYPRQNVHRILTPEGFRMSKFDALPSTKLKNSPLLGVAEMFLAAGLPVTAVKTDIRSLKITYPTDWEFFCALYEHEKAIFG